jgi:hypothetical protein
MRGSGSAPETQPTELSSPISTQRLARGLPEPLLTAFWAPVQVVQVAPGAGHHGRLDTGPVAASLDDRRHYGVRPYGTVGIAHHAQDQPAQSPSRNSRMRLEILLLGRASMSTDGSSNRSVASTCRSDPQGLAAF